jgi:hypothetical protein
MIIHLFKIDMGKTFKGVLKQNKKEMVKRLDRKNQAKNTLRYSISERSTEKRCSRERV